MPIPSAVSASRRRARREFRCSLLGQLQGTPLQAGARDEHLSRGVALVRTTPDGHLAVSTPDGGITFRLVPRDRGLFVDQLVQDDDGSSARMSMLFSERIAFADWCQWESARLQHPQIFERVRQYGHEVFDRAHH